MPFRIHEADQDEQDRRTLGLEEVELKPKVDGKYVVATELNYPLELIPTTEDLQIKVLMHSRKQPLDATEEEPLLSDSEIREIVAMVRARVMNTEVYVNVYLQDRAYGGPEEGGWWYDCEQVIRVLPTVRQFAADLKNRMEAQFSNEGRPSTSSVLSKGRYAVRVEMQPGSSSPEERPRYE